MGKQASRRDFLITGSTGMELPFPSRKLFQQKCASCGRPKSQHVERCDCGPAYPASAPLSLLPFKFDAAGLDTESDAMSGGILTPLASEYVFRFPFLCDYAPSPCARTRTHTSATLPISQPVPLTAWTLSLARALRMGMRSKAWRAARVSLRLARLPPLQAGCGAHVANAPRLRLRQAFSRMFWSQNSKS
jgi:hypothetical protein